MPSDDGSQTDQRTGRPDDQRTGRPAQPPPGLSSVEAARRAVRRVHELTGLEPESVTGLQPGEQGWKVDVEVVEMERVPSTTDVMATYQVELDEQGRMVACRRTERHYRGRADGFRR